MQLVNDHTLHLYELRGPPVLLAQTRNNFPHIEGDDSLTESFYQCGAESPVFPEKRKKLRCGILFVGPPLVEAFPIKGAMRWFFFYAHVYKIRKGHIK